MQVITEKQRRTYFLLLTLLTIVLVAAQFGLHYLLETASTDLAIEYGELENLKQTVDARHVLLERYKAFEAQSKSEGMQPQVYPETALELFTAVDSALKENQVEHTNRNSSSGTEPGGVLQLQITFSGSYYNVMKALAQLRSGQYAMCLADFSITAENDGRVTGHMTILSNSRKI